MTRSCWTGSRGDAVPHAGRVLLAGRAGHWHRGHGVREGSASRVGRLGVARTWAGFGDQDFYPDVIDKAAVLTCRLAWNHPLPDGNKRAAWAALVMFVDLNGGTWEPDPPDVDDAESAMLAVAAHEVDEAWLAQWLREHVHFA